MNHFPASQDGRVASQSNAGGLRAAAALVALALLAALPARADLARVGPANVPAPPGNGFPLWYQDLTGRVLDLCLPDASDPGALQQTACLLGPPNPPYVFPTNFPDEVFYYRAVSAPLATGPSTRAVLVLALEAAFASGAPAAGQQMVFTRIRVTAGVPADGDYKVVHPYGVEFFPGVVASGGNRDIFFTEDVGITPGAFAEALSSRVGPFLQASATEGGAPSAPVTLNGAQFLSDGVALVNLTGSPFGTNFFQICGPIDPATGNGPCVSTNQFSLTGRLRDLVANPIASPLAVERSTYARDASGSRIDVSASASAGVGQAVPRLSAGGLDIPPVLMNGPTALGEYYAQGIPVPAGAVPQTVTVTNSADVPPSSVAAHILDEVTVLSATYDAGTLTLTVVATSSDKGTATILPPTLALDGFAATPVFGAPGDPAQTTLTVTGVAVPPPFVRVASAAGGQGRMDVSMVNVGAFAAGVPFAQDDLASATQNGLGVTIAVLANDVFPAAAPALGGPALVGPAPTLGTAAVQADGTVLYTPGPSTGTDSFRYTVSNSVGPSNVAFVTVNVVTGAGGPVPTAIADGPVTVATGASTVIDVLANDNANGGTLDPASVTITTAPASGTATVNTATGTVTYTAGATPGTVTFAYTVRNVGGATPSAPATVTVTVVTPELVTVTRAQCKRNGNQWVLRGTSTVSTGNTVTAFNTALVPALPQPSQVVGSSPVAAGAWQIQVRNGLPCTSPVSFQSTLGTKVENVAVQIQ